MSLDTIVSEYPQHTFCDRILENISPAAVVDLWHAGVLETSVAADILSKYEPKTKLHSLSGKTLKQGGRGKTLAQVLATAARVDVAADLAAVANDALQRFNDAAITKAVVKMNGKLADDVRGSISAKWFIEWKQMFPLISVRPGTYSRFAESMERCDQQFLESQPSSDYRRHLKLKFDIHGSSHVTINDKKIYLPSGTQILASGSGDSFKVWVYCLHTYNFPKAPFYRIPAGVCINADGSAVFAGTESTKLKDFLACWNDDAVNTAEIIGKACSRCFWCGRELTNSESVKRHAGPVCQPRYNGVLRMLASSRPKVVTVVDVQPRPSVVITLPNPAQGQKTDFNVPKLVAEASGFLQAFCNDDICVEDEDEVLRLLQQVHAITPQTLEDLDSLLASPGSQGTLSTTRLGKALFAADVLSMGDLPGILLDEYVNRHMFHWKNRLSTTCLEKMEVSRVQLAQVAPTPFVVPKRTRDYESYHDLLNAIRSEDAEAIRRLAREVPFVPTWKPTKDQMRELGINDNQCGKLYELAMTTSESTLRLLLELKLEPCNLGPVRSAVALSVQLLSLLRRAWPDEWWKNNIESFIHTALRAHSNDGIRDTEPSLDAVIFLLDLRRTLNPTEIPWDVYVTKIKSQALLEGLINEGYVPHTQVIVDKILFGDFPTVVTKLEPARKAHLQTLLAPPRHVHRRIPSPHNLEALCAFDPCAYKSFLDADILADYVHHRQTMHHHSIHHVFAIYTGIVEPRHLIANSESLKVIAEKTGRVFTHGDTKWFLEHPEYNAGGRTYNNLEKTLGVDLLPCVPELLVDEYPEEDRPDLLFKLIWSLDKTPWEYTDGLFISRVVQLIKTLVSRKCKVVHSCTRDDYNRWLGRYVNERKWIAKHKAEWEELKSLRSILFDDYLQD